MNCKEVQELLSVYEGELLAARETAEVQSHLAVCKFCQKELAALSATWAMLGVLEPVTPSSEFRARFWEKVRQGEEKRYSWLAFPRWIPIFAGFLGVWVSGVGMGATLYMRTHTNPAISGLQNSTSLGTAYLRHSMGDRV